MLPAPYLRCMLPAPHLISTNIGSLDCQTNASPILYVCYAIFRPYSCRVLTLRIKFQQLTCVTMLVYCSKQQKKARKICHQCLRCSSMAWQEEVCTLVQPNVYFDMLLLKSLSKGHNWHTWCCSMSTVTCKLKNQNISRQNRA